MPEMSPTEHVVVFAGVTVLVALVCAVLKQPTPERAVRSTVHYTIFLAAGLGAFAAAIWLTDRLL